MHCGENDDCLDNELWRHLMEKAIECIYGYDHKSVNRNMVVIW